LSLFFLRQKLNFYHSRASEAKTDFISTFYPQKNDGVFNQTQGTELKIVENSDQIWDTELRKYSHYQQYKSRADQNFFRNKFEDFKENAVLASCILAAIAQPFGLAPVFIKP